jgi:hypothetical protein
MKSARNALRYSRLPLGEERIGLTSHPDETYCGSMEQCYPQGEVAPGDVKFLA